MSMMLDSAFVDRSQFSKGGVKRMIIGGVIEVPQNQYQQLEANAERLMVSFPQKDKLQLMSLLKELDNRVEVAHDILSSELTQTRNVLEDSMLIGNLELKQEQTMNNQPPRRALFNLRPKTNHKNDRNQITSSSKQSDDQLYQQQQLSQDSTITQQQDVISANINCDNETPLLTIKQESSEFSSNSQIKDQDIPEVEQQQPSFTNTTSRQNIQVQQPPPSRRLKDIPQINQFQKNLMEQIVPALVQELGKNNIQQAPQLIYESLRYYEEENRRAVQFEKIISSHDILLKAFANQYSKIQRCEKTNAELLQEKQALTAERDKFKNLSQRLAIMFNNTNNCDTDHLMDRPPYDGEGGGSGPREFCF